MDNICTIPLFSTLEPAIGEQYGKRCLWKDYEAHELIIDIDEETTDVRFVISGLVRVISRFSVGKEVILGEMSPGEFFGELSAFDGATRSANVTALYRTRICVMPQSVFLELVRTSDEINLAVIRVLTQRIRQLNMRLAEQSFLQAKHRLYAELIRLSKPRPANPEQRSISPPPTQKELAERIGTRREVVSRELNALQKEGVFEKGRGALVLCDVAELQKRISNAWNE
ncbi:MAG: Crp/Fnr family transcriptional regulator [Rhizobiaceae bacterium]|jgi:CRP-like cAMP-binding protein|nr:Crp/Fnr family transcriptional regulator [Rhizobiaceae bacterium]